MRRNLLFWFEVFVLFVIPVYILGLSPTLLAYRPYLFLFGLCYVSLRGYFHRATLFSWGLTTKGITRDWHYLLSVSLALPILTFILLGSVANPIRVWLIGYDMLTVALPLRLILYIFVSVPIQELIFRSYLFWRLKGLAWRPTVISSVSTILFVAGHLPFHSPIILMVVTAMGVVYASLYSKHSNLWPIMISHALIGSLLILVRNYYLPY